jgi:hypothetical protein
MDFYYVNFNDYFWNSRMDIICEKKYYSLVKNDEFNQIKETALISKAALKVYKKQNDSLQKKIGILTHSKNQNEKDLKSKSEQINKLEKENETLKNQNNSLAYSQNETQTVQNNDTDKDTGATEVVQTPTENIPPYQISAFYTSSPIQNQSNQWVNGLLVAVTITNNTNERITVRPHTLNLVLSNDQLPYLDEDETRNFEKVGDSMPILGLFVGPNQTRTASVIYRVDEGVKPISISWEGPSGKAEYKF